MHAKDELMQIFASVTTEELSIQSGIESLGQLFAIVLALAIGEAFRQFVSDDGETGKNTIHWERIGALVGFVVLIVPFFHGMARYFFDVYLTPVRPDHYGIFLLFDTLVFTVEAVIFFILARSLDPKDDRKFYAAVLVLLVVDVAWGLVVALCDVSDDVWYWVWINAAIALILFVVLWMCRKTEDLGRVVQVCMCLLVLRTILDYSLLWKFYFPPEPNIVGLGSSGEGAVSKPIIYIASPYTKGDVAMNTHFQCKVFDQMLSDGKVWPIAPLW